MDRYDHLKADEKEIAKRWVAQVPIQGRREYDIKLDVPLLDIPDWWTKKDIENWQSLRAKRIDMVVHAADAIWIMEITPKLSKAAVGGCQLYKSMYELQFKPEKPVKMGIIVEVDDPAYHPVCKALRIRYWVV